MPRLKSFMPDYKQELDIDSHCLSVHLKVNSLTGYGECKLIEIISQLGFKLASSHGVSTRSSGQYSTFTWYFVK